MFGLVEYTILQQRK
jgi:transportin-1